MKLSVIIPIYNGADFIRKSYNTIINQQLEDFEILYVDNNSKDASVEIIKDLIIKDFRIKLISQTKQGAAAARNKGIKNAQGEYLYLFDVDDEIYPDALQKMIAVLDAYPNMDAVFGKMVKSNKGILETTKPDGETNSVVIKESPYWGLQWFSSLKTVVGPPAFLYRKGVIDRIGYYDEDLKIGEDTALDIILGMTCKVAFIDTYIYLYFKHPNSSLEQSKKELNQVFILWSRLVKSHLPFYLSHKVPYEFKRNLFNQIFSSMGKIIVYSTTFKNRFNVYKKIPTEIYPIKLSFSIRFYLIILVFLPIQALLKLYVYYFAKWYVNKHFDQL